MILKHLPSKLLQTNLTTPMTLYHNSNQFPWVKMIIPENAYKVCTDRLFISITVLTRYGPVNRIISQFSSNDDLLQACMASSTLPYLTERAGCRTFRGEYVLDGGLTNNIPVFTDGVRRQLVFRLFDVEYPWRLLINAQGMISAITAMRSIIDIFSVLKFDLTAL